MEATKFKSRREHRKDVHRFNRYVKGDTWDSEVSSHQKQLEPQSYQSLLFKPANGSNPPTTQPKLNNEFDLLSSVHASEYSTLTSTPHPPNLKPAHKFTLELDSDACTTEKYNLYSKYQRIIHHEAKREITREQFKRFLCSSPLRGKPHVDKFSGESRPTGTFHQLYRIDGVLIAIAVLDLLPNTVSSVYFIYDPESMGKFGMGKVSAVREVAMCVEGGYKYYGLGMPPNRFG
jgi:arginyl-tRNA---protein transferase